MNDLQKVLIIIGILLFLLVGIVTLFFLFGGIMGFSGDTIAVIDMRGEIAASDASGYISAAAMRAMLKDAEEDPSVVAVVLNIDSGGGGVIESKEIARAVSKFAEKKPIISYIGDIGASGAYYVAAHTDYIISDEDSLIGSIGVISTYMEYQNLLEEKLGINTTVIKSGKFKDIGSPYRQMTDEEKERLQGIVDTIHQEFLSVIVSKRGLTQDEIAKVDSASIFLGSEAYSMNLIDATGGLDSAVEKARALGKSPDAEVKYLKLSDYSGNDIYYSIGKGVGDSLTEKLELSDSSLRLV